MLEVRTATVADRRDVVRVMAAAFDDDPVTRWLVPAGRSLTPLFATHARWAHDAPARPISPCWTGSRSGQRSGTRPAIVSRPGASCASIPFYARALRRNLARGVALENVMHRARPHGEFWYLAGVGALRRGEGIGTALLRHRLERVSGAAYLESSKRENIPLYERLGFELRDSLQLPEGPELWPMWRPG